MQQITSKKNDVIKEIKKLDAKKNRKKNNRYLIEGLHLIDEALKYNVEIVHVLVTDKYVNHRLVKENYDTAFEITEELSEYISDTKSPQGIFAVAHIDENNKINDFHGKWILLDNVQDPGNVGTIIRTADAAGFDGVILGDNTADIYQGKVQRSTQGSQFHIKTITTDTKYIMGEFKNNGIPVWATEVNRHAKPITELNKVDDVLIVMGNEANGLNQDVLNLADEQTFIPIFGKAESLNVGVAASVMMYYLSLGA
ncbi:rRNA methyltransferase [Companilactobacillus sp. RD055328]|uniref:TrmH family RNA methyltransferase n=1 Tax=Companilactobacillus sp. RD055328 TaxID=2916634 RepID=UPI001FC80E30|nr:RNA methyltransferase [Companilactobacillus sp. RD055328]GKQ42526.1 rRNA methyltransferase [Companilactobacillus sp. RD055328]